MIAGGRRGSGGAGEGDERPLQVTSLAQGNADLMPSLGLVGETEQKIAQHIVGFRVATFDERQAEHESGVRPCGRALGGTPKQIQRLSEIAESSCRSARKDEGRRMIRPQRQTGTSPPRCIIELLAPQSYGR